MRVVVLLFALGACAGGPSPVALLREQGLSAWLYSQGVIRVGPVDRAWSIELPEVPAARHRRHRTFIEVPLEADQGAIRVHVFDPGTVRLRDGARLLEELVAEVMPWQRHRLGATQFRGRPALAGLFERPGSASHIALVRAVFAGPYVFIVIRVTPAWGALVDAQLEEVVESIRVRAEAP